MPKNKDSILQNIKTNPLAWVVQIVGLLVVILNIWIATKLAPIAQDLAVIQTRVDATELNLVPRGELGAQFENITDRLNRIENKLDKLIEEHITE